MDDDSSMRANLGQGSNTVVAKLPLALRVEIFLADPCHRTRVFGGKTYALATMKVGTMNQKGWVTGDSRFNTFCAAKCKQYHGYVLAESKLKGVDHLQKHWYQALECLFDRHENDDGTTCMDYFDCPALRNRANGKELSTRGEDRRSR